MSRMPIAYFEKLYAADPDPWGMEQRWYEQRKYALTLASLPRKRYRSAFEPACSVGVLTELLAGRCDTLLSCDVMDVPLYRARSRVAGLDHVRVERASLPEDWPPGPFDLLILSEMAYYFSADDLAALLDAATASLAPGADVVAVHWRGETDYPLSGDETHRLLGEVPGWRPVARHEEADFLLDVWTVP